MLSLFVGDIKASHCQDGWTLMGSALKAEFWNVPGFINMRAEQQLSTKCRAVELKAILKIDVVVTVNASYFTNNLAEVINYGSELKHNS